MTHTPLSCGKQYVIFMVHSGRFIHVTIASISDEVSFSSRWMNMRVGVAKLLSKVEVRRLPVILPDIGESNREDE